MKEFEDWLSERHASLAVDYVEGEGQEGFEAWAQDRWKQDGVEDADLQYELHRDRVMEE